VTIRVILADDQPLVRAGLRRLIEQTPDIDVAGEAGTGAEAVRLARDTSPDVVVMDIRMPGMDGIEATRLITAGETHARVLMLTTFDDDDYVYGALRAGASGFLVKDMALEDILTAIRVVAAGDAMIAPAVTRRLIGQFAGRPRSGRSPKEVTGITDREREVLRLVGLGMSNAEIAAALYITAGTAKTHVARGPITQREKQQSQSQLAGPDSGRRAGHDRDDTRTSCQWPVAVATHGNYLTGTDTSAVAPWMQHGHRKRSAGVISSPLPSEVPSRRHWRAGTAGSAEPDVAAGEVQLHTLAGHADALDHHRQWQGRKREGDVTQEGGRCHRDAAASHLRGRGAAPVSHRHPAEPNTRTTQGMPGYPHLLARRTRPLTAAGVSQNSPNRSPARA